ncbi:sugar phosphate isomerase/epimerase family protein [Youxingia wuxianensis]|uniref:Sugar phosphate isomerase/epimerase n=1 Tax=Youxingia wuxianensis TaxID=2763678 RepID=A0A926ERI1_9FIRM|nr:sugar phosphate isomerase/epimerase family protein [Youxingia wuxianensis]MBC8585184.1 sugar phosphate isomerase/epimerase [Youxingia wuxianensis]
MSKLLPSQLATTNSLFTHWTLKYFMDNMVKLGVENVDFWCGHPHFWFNDAPVSQAKNIKKEFDARGLKIISLIPEQNNHDINIASENEYFRARSIDIMTFFIDAANEMGVDKLVLFPGKCFIDHPHSMGWKLSRDSIAKLTAHAEKRGVTLLFENQDWKKSSLVLNKDAQKRMLDEINSPNLKAVVDTDPVVCANETLEQYFETLGKDNIRHIHLSNEGYLPWDEEACDALDAHLDALRKYDYNGYITIEIADEECRWDPVPLYASSLDLVKKHLG